MSKNDESFSIFHLEQKTELEKFNCYLSIFSDTILAEVVSSVVKSEYTPDIKQQIYFAN